MTTTISSRPPSSNTPRDRALFASLVRAHKARAITVIVKAAKLNQPGSPLWDPIHNLAPLCAILLAGILVLVATNVLAGTAVMTLGALVYAMFIRPYVLRSVQDRALEAAVGHVHNWELLWKQGGVVVRRDGVMGAICVSPSGDWRGFVTAYLPVVETDMLHLAPERRRIGKKERQGAAPEFGMARPAAGFSRAAG